MTVEIMIVISSKKLEGLIDTVSYPLPSKLRGWDKIKYFVPALYAEQKKRDKTRWVETISLYGVQTVILSGTLCYFQGQWLPHHWQLKDSF